MISRSTYETRYRAAEKSESDAEKLKFGSKAKEAEKARIRATQSRTAAFKADEEYKYSVTTLEEARGNWVGYTKMLLSFRLIYVRVSTCMSTRLQSNLKN